MRAELEQVLHGRAESQLGLVTRSQLLADLGLGRGQVRRLLACGRLVRVHEAVYRIAAVPVGPEQALLAACWAGGHRGGVVSHRAAAWLWRLPGGDEQLVEVTGPRWRRSRHDGVVAHESRHLRAGDLTEIGPLPVTKPARTLLDLAAVVDRAVLQDALEEAVRRQLVSVPLLWTLWEAHGGRLRNGGTRLAAALAAWQPVEGGTPTRHELELARVLRARGYPDPVAQHEVRLPDGRRAFVDFAWPAEQVALELDPYRWHGGRFHYEHTVERRLALQSRGWEVVTVGGRDLEQGAPRALAALDGLLLGRR